MKKIILFPLFLLALFFVSCNEKTPMETNLYPEEVYIVGARDKVIYRDLNIGYETDTIYASVAVSGSLPTDRDVHVVLAEFPEAIDNYNERNVTSDDVQFRNPEIDIYSFDNNVTVKKGNVYGTCPIYINPATLHIDSLYMLSLKMEETSAFTMAETDTVVLIKLNLKNDYSGQYYMNGMIKNKVNTNDSTVYKMPRTLQAVKDGKTVRMYHEKNEWVKGETDYRPDYCFNITINDDNTLSLEPWEFFELEAWGGKYIPEYKLYDIWYDFNDISSGMPKRARGFLYKEPENEDDQRILEDWMVENRVYDNF